MPQVREVSLTVFFSIVIQPDVHTESDVRSASFPGDVAALYPKRDLSPGDYNVLMRVFDADMQFQDSTLDVEVCHCQGAVSTCFIPRTDPHLKVSSLTTPILGAIFGLLSM